MHCVVYLLTVLKIDRSFDFLYFSLPGMLSHQLKRNVIDGEKSIIQNPSEGQK